MIIDLGGVEERVTAKTGKDLEQQIGGSTSSLRIQRAADGLRQDRQKAGARR